MNFNTAKALIAYKIENDLNRDQVEHELESLFYAKRIKGLNNLYQSSKDNKYILNHFDSLQSYLTTRTDRISLWIIVSQEKDVVLKEYKLKPFQ